MDLGIAGRTALVTGASGGLGLATAQALAGAGVRVAIVARSVERLAAASETIEGDPVSIPADLSRPDEIDEMISAAQDALGDIDILVANAGGPPPGNFASTDLEAYPEALQLNLLSTVAMCKALVPPMQERGWGRVVAITSISVRQPIDQLILSNTARAGLTAFLKTTATEVAPDGVTVNTVQPGLHATDRLTQLYDDLDTVASRLPTGVLGDPGDFGRVVAFVCSESARSITGASIPVDGGTAKGLQ
ncbi:MAG: SDR family oxidoreductase [Acidimicrobiia bacterium]|nr:SDR family oxidoreductase [Actinomycetota bacterium]MBL6925340.1 SDR family oxidoreductase [Acidimicrobiia bacterium]MBL6926004.1 SDR family oxidoreductase [Acidimicrobiia bacterium]